jgi:hypothetical protein
MARTISTITQFHSFKEQQFGNVNSTATTTNWINETWEIAIFVFRVPGIPRNTPGMSMRDYLYGRTAIENDSESKE